LFYALFAVVIRDYGTSSFSQFKEKVFGGRLHHYLSGAIVRSIHPSPSLVFEQALFLG